MIEMSFNKLEQGLLRFLKEEYLEKGSKPQTMFDPATLHSDVMAKFGLEHGPYREVMARLECLGIVKVIPPGTKYGHLQISSMVVEIVRQLDELAAKSSPRELPAEGAQISEMEVPAAFREGGGPDGAVLTVLYLEESPKWLLKGPYLTKHYGAELTTHIKVGRAKAYLYRELLVLRDRKTDNLGKREQR